MPSSLLLPIAQQFAIDAEIIAIDHFGEGLINDTFLVSTDSNSHRHFILQRLNNEVFAKPEWVMANIDTLLTHLNFSKDEQAPLTFPEIIRTREDLLYYSDSPSENNEPQSWRALSYIENSQSFEKITQTSDAEQIGSALGEFHRRVSDLPLNSFHDTLPGFHITPGYLAEYQQIRSRKPSSPEIRFCQKFIGQQQPYASVLETAKQQGLLLEQVIHGDPKLNNLLFSKTTQQVVSIIDLDTVKPGLVHYDIGDCLRSSCQTENPVRFDIDICELILSHYLNQVRNVFSDYDYQFLYPAIQLLPFELGLRFFTDYLQGNPYFKVTDTEQNLDRACRQFQLVQSIHNQQKQIERLIRSLKNANG